MFRAFVGFVILTILCSVAPISATTCPITNPCGAVPTPLPSGGTATTLDAGPGTCFVITGMLLWNP